MRGCAPTITSALRECISNCSQVDVPVPAVDIGPVLSVDHLPARVTLAPLGHAFVVKSVHASWACDGVS